MTLGPLLGLLGTVIGMIRAFGVLGSENVAEKTAAITGGIAESLIAGTPWPIETVTREELGPARFLG